jgi:hypothetical protein
MGPPARQDDVLLTIFKTRTSNPVTCAYAVWSRSGHTLGMI